MYPLRCIVQCVPLILLSTQPIFSELIRFNDGEIFYEYDNSSTPLGKGGFGTVYEGIRTEGNHTESVAIKELRESHEKLLKESKICEILGQHDSFPTFYRYFPTTNQTKAVFVMERIGKSLTDLWSEFRPFSVITTLKIGLEILDAVEWMHSIGITHNDLHSGNIAVGYHNKSKIYLFDFSLTEMNKSATTDLWRLSFSLNDLILPYDLATLNEPNNALVEFKRVAKEYSNIDDDFRNEIFGKLRSILMTQLESHKNDAAHAKYVDIGYVQDTVDGINLLRKLIKQNDIAAIKNLLQSDQQLNVNAGFGNSSNYKPIHLAAELGYARLVQLLVVHGAEVNLKYNETYYAMSPIHLAIRNGNAEVVRILCECGAQTNAKLLDGKTSLHFAALHGKDDDATIKLVGTLIEYGAEINAEDNNKITSLNYAIDNRKINLVKFLVTNHAELNLNHSDGKTPLHFAVENGQMSLTQFLMRRGFDIRATDNDRRTMLHYAAMSGNVELFWFLYKYDWDINAKSAGEETPLHYAVRRGHMDLIRVLIECGADTRAMDKHGNSILHYAAMSGSIELFQFCSEYDFDINLKSFNGETPLHLAVLYGCVELVQFLIENRADIKVVDNNGQTALDIANYYRLEEMVKILKEAEENEVSMPRNA